jgi:molybdate transport system ATP-binding protein
VVYVTHSVDEVARLADHGVLLDNGRVQAQGSVFELMTRADLPLARGDGAGALIEAVTCGVSGESGLCELRFDGGSLLLPQTRTTPLPERTPVRVRIQARDVSLSLVFPEQTSVLNILPTVVSDLSDDGPGQVLVGLRLGADTRLLARISRLSTERLGLAPGMAVFAQIKGVAMVR